MPRGQDGIRHKRGHSARAGRASDRTAGSASRRPSGSRTQFGAEVTWLPFDGRQLILGAQPRNVFEQLLNSSATQRPADTDFAAAVIADGRATEQKPFESIYETRGLLILDEE